MESFLFHSIKFNNMDTLYKIMETGFILPRCMIPGSESMDKNNIFNGTKYISLTMKSIMGQGEKELFKSSFDELTQGSLCFVIDKVPYPDLIFPSCIIWDMLSPDEAREIKFKDGKNRYTYYLDEVQTDKPIPTSSFIAIGYPNNKFNFNLGQKKNEEQLNELYNHMHRYGLQIPIVNSDVYDFADDREKIKKYTLVK